MTDQNRFWLVAFCLAVSSLAAQAQTVSVIGWDAPAAVVTSAVSSPYGVAADYNGAIYVADSGNQRVIQLTPGQATSGSTAIQYQLAATIASTATFGANFNPTSVAVDQLLDVYIADQATGSVIRLLRNATGFDAPVTVFTGLSTSAVSKIVPDAGGNLYIADPGNHRVIEVPLSGTTYGTPINIASYSTGGSAAIAIDANLNLYFSDSSDGQIMEAIRSGTGYNIPVAVITGLSTVRDVAIDSHGNLYFTSAGGINSAAWLGGTKFDTPFAVGGNSIFGQPWGLAFGSFGTIIEADQQANTVSTVLPPGNFGSQSLGIYSSVRYVSFRFDTASTVTNVGTTSTNESPNLYNVPRDFVTVSSLLSDSCPNNGYGAGGTCTVPIQFLPHHAGTLTGALNLYGSNGTPLISLPLIGNGAGAEIAFTPTQTNFPVGLIGNEFVFDGNGNLYYVKLNANGSNDSVVEAVWNGAGFNSPITLLSDVVSTGLGIDSAGNVYVGDSKTTTIVKLPVMAGNAGQFGAPITIWTGTQPITYYYRACGESTSIDVLSFVPPATFDYPCTELTYMDGLGQSLGPVTVDPAGNVYFQDYTSGTLDQTQLSQGTFVDLGATLNKLPIISGGYGAPQIFAPSHLEALINQHGYLPIAVDASGDVFFNVTNSVGASAIYELNLSVTGYSAAIPVLTGLSGTDPLSFALDGNGDIYATSSSYTNPVATVVRARFNGTSWVSTIVASLPHQEFYGLALDAVGNPWVSTFSGVDEGSGLNVGVPAFSKLDITSFPTVNFPTSTYVGQTDTTDGPQTVTLNNIGNQPLVLNPVYPNSFPANTADANLCLAGNSLLPGQSCDLSMTFAPAPVSSGPPNVGALSQSVLSSGTVAVSTAAPAVSVNGTGLSDLALAFGTAPAAGVEVGGNAGSAITVLVESLGSIVTSANQSITLTVSGPNSYAATYTATASAGVAVFNLSGTALTATGAYAYQASIQSTGTSYAPVTASESVVSAVATNLAFGTPPATVLLTGGNGGSAITVQELDAVGLVHTQAADIISVTVTGPSGYSATYNATAAGGVATFNLAAVPLNLTGTYTYTAKSGSLGSATATEAVNPNTISFGSVDAGKSSTAVPVTLVFTANLVGFPGTPLISTLGTTGKDFTPASGGTCNFSPNSLESFYAGQSCTVNVVFTPSAPGVRPGAVAVYDANSNLVAQTLITGVGVGARASFAGGQTTTVYSASNGFAPGIAVTGRGDVYVTDSAAYGVFFVPWNGTSYGSPVSEGDLSTITLEGQQFTSQFFFSPGQIALDGAGNTYVAVGGSSDVGAPPAVVKMGTIQSGGSPICCTAEQYLGSGWERPVGIAVDASGNVYVSDLGNGNIYEIPFTGKGYGTQIQIASGISTGQLAIDGRGNIFAAAQDKGIYEISPTATGFAAPVKIANWNAQSIAVDGSGNVYVIDTNAGQVIRIPWTGIAFGPGVAVTGPGVADGGLAVDSAGNVYIHAKGQGSVVKIATTIPASLQFATTSVEGTTDTADGPQTIALYNTGNEDLIFSPAISYPASFPANTADSHLCSSKSPLALGAACDVSANFAPQTGGTVSANVLLSDNSSSGATQTIATSGTAFAVPPSGSQVFYAGMELTPFNVQNGSESIAVDPAGNVFTNNGNTEIDEWSPSATGYVHSSTLSDCCFWGGHYEGGQIAVDNSDNVYSGQWNASTGPGTQHLYQNQAPIGNGLTYATATALDPSQTHLYVADDAVDANGMSGSRGSNIWMMTAPFGISANFAPILPINGSPMAVAADKFGDIFVDNWISKNPDVCQESEFTPTGGGQYTQSIISSRCSYGLAVRDDGSVFLADYDNAEVVRQAPNGSGGWTEFSIVSGINLPTGASFDSHGNLWISEYASSPLEVVFSPSFPATPLGSSSSFSVNLSVAAGVTLGSVRIVTDGQAGLDFNDAGGSTCTAQPYTSPAACTVNVNFTPTASGARGGAVILYDQNGNPMNTVLLQGIGTGPVPVFETPSVSLIAPATSSSYQFGVTAVDGAGNVYIPSSANNQIMIAAPGGTATALSLTSPSLNPNVAQPTASAALNNPSAIAVGPDGTQYIADTGNNRILVRQPTGTAANYYLYNLSTASFTLNAPQDVITDAAGDVFIADSGNNRILEVSPSSATAQFGPLFANPGSIAVDSSGNVYVTNSLTPSVSMISSNGQTVTRINTGGTSLEEPSGLAVDAAGTIYIADQKVGVVEVSATGSVHTMNLPQLPGALYPGAVSLDQAGNVYLSTTGAGVYEVQRNGTSLSFVTTKTGTTSIDSPKMARMQNVGNKNLNITGISYPADFPMGAGDANACTNATSVVAGGGCDLPVTFLPASGTTLNEQVTINDNAANLTGATQSVSVNGMGVVGGQSQTLTLKPRATCVCYPYGSVGGTFYLGDSAGLPVTIRVLSGPMNFNGALTTVTQTVAGQNNLFSFNDSGAGSGVIEADQAGNSTYAPATPVQLSYTISPLGLTFRLNEPPTASQVYGGTPHFTYTLTNLLNSTDKVQVYIASGITTKSPVGIYTVTYGLTGPSASSYYLVSGSTTGPLAVTPAPLTVAATDAYMNTSGAVPALGYTLLGLLNGDTVATAITGAPALSTTASSSSSAGSYPITLSLGTLASTNYTLSAANGVLNAFAPINLGTAAVGSSVTQTLSFTEGPASNFGGVTATTQPAGLNSFAAGPFACVAGTCSGSLTLAPALPGNLNGSYQLVSPDNPSSVLLSIPANGTGTGPRIQFLPSLQSTVGTGFNSPQGVATDSAGNIYIADSGNNRVIEVLANGGQQISLGSGLSNPTSVAVDSSGNVFIVDTGNRRVLKLSATGGAQTVLATGFLNAAGIAVDSASNFYVTDSAAGTVQKFLVGGGSPVAIGSGWQHPFGIAIDGAGDLFVVDISAGRVVELPAGGGSQILLPISGLNDANGVAVDQTGNVFVSDTLNNRILELPVNGTGQFTLLSSVHFPSLMTVGSNGDLYVSDGNNVVLSLNPNQPPTLTFAATQVNTIASGGPQTVTVVNQGNASLAFSAVTYPSNFPEASGVGTDCTSSSNLLPGATCTLSVNFSPLGSSATGPGTQLNQSVILSDNNLNGTTAVQSVAATGTAVKPAQPTAQTITLPTLAGQTYGAAPVTLVATASSGLSVSYTVTGPAKLSSSTLTFTGAGTVAVTATQAGNATYAPAAPVTQSFAVARAPLTVKANSVARVSGAPNPSLTYSLVGFVNGDASAVVGGSATLTTTAASTSPAGSYPITFAMEGLSAANYTFTYIAGILTVTASGTHCSVVDYSKGFTSTGLTLNGSAKITNGLLQLTDGKPSEAASAYFSTPLPTTSFTTDVTLQLLNPVADGMTLTIQALGPHALGQAGGGLGYAGIPKSIALKVDLHNNAGEGTNSTGIYYNGAAPTEPSITLNGSGIDLHSGHIFELHVTYDGATTKLTLTDTLTKATWTDSLPGSIAEELGTHSAYFGFTAGTGGESAIQNILSWTYSGGTGCAANGSGPQ